MSNITVNQNIMMQNFYTCGSNMLLPQQPITSMYTGHVTPGMVQFLQSTSGQQFRVPQEMRTSGRNVYKNDVHVSQNRWATPPSMNTQISRHERIVFKTTPWTQKSVSQDKPFPTAEYTDWNFRQDINAPDMMEDMPSFSNESSLPASLSQQASHIPVKMRHENLAKATIYSQHHSPAFNPVTTPLRQLCLPSISTSSNVAVNVMSDEFDLGYYSFSDSASLADSIDDINCQPLSEDDDVTGFSDIIDDVLGSIGSRQENTRAQQVSNGGSPGAVTTRCTPGRPEVSCSDIISTFSKPEVKMEQTSFYCELCNKHLNSQNNLRSHMKLHKGDRPHACPVCNKRFSQKSTLRTHIRTHTGEKPYACTYCDRSFADYSTYRKHLRTHTGEKPYTCDVCHKSFTQSGNMIRHKEVHTRELKKKLATR